MKVFLGALNPSDVVGTIVDTVDWSDKYSEPKRKTVKMKAERYDTIEEFQEAHPDIYIEPIKAPKAVPLIVKAENVINPGRSTGKIYVDGKLVDEETVLKQIVNEPEEKKTMLEELISLVPLGGLALLAFGL